MSDRQPWDSDVSSLLQNIYRCADKSSWYDSVAEAYDRTRPRYPDKILAQMQQIAQLRPGKSVLEIGTGPGIATVELAKLGAELVCLEPSKSACQIAEDKCQAFSRVKFINQTFEAWDLAEQRFDAVIATTSFHWITPEVRYFKTAAALKDNGWLILLWNTPPQPSLAIHHNLVEVYQQYAPELANYEGHQNHQNNLMAIGEKVIASGCFKDLVCQQQVVKVVYSLSDYLTLLTTLSPYIKLESQQREALLAELQRILQLNFGGSLELNYLSLLQIAKKV